MNPVEALKRIDTALETYAPGIGGMQAGEWEFFLHQSVRQLLGDYLTVWLDFYSGRDLKEAQRKTAGQLTDVVEEALKGAGYDLTVGGAA
jgi:hypothetical protein